MAAAVLARQDPKCLCRFRVFRGRQEKNYSMNNLQDMHDRHNR